MSSPLDLDTELVPGRRVLCRELEGEAVLLDLRSGRYFGLDPVGTRIWALLGELRSARRIAAQLERQYDVESRRLEDDLLELLASLLEHGLVVPETDAGAPPSAREER